ncbi:MAG TPA: tRNA (adenosine(37)-N6)-threonylcarbamoyltransferase complex ATPase subunit type 1 TsaE [Rhodospirillales bacterium]|nr:tRNA (adenosine(37)-N6)-threonylcarbamoyltransferase complex ATPase subunit type 1 TsaE [Rhodospirillales bacterium]|tara:strand:+ start:356 stop:847 length:492 start_codon:yes stop_codon:yes gene_type:complete
MHEAKSMDHSTVIDLASEAATAALAGVLARLARAGDIFALAGELGAGKSVFARAFINELAPNPEEIPSPTFTLVQAYDLGRVTVYHFDLFRLAGPDEVFELGIEEAFAGGISLIEWPDRLGRLLPRDHLWLSLAHGGDANSRRATLTGHGNWAGRLKEADIDV